jgi:hypothetical protein
MSNLADITLALVQLPSTKWKEVTLRVMWMQRTRTTTNPPEILASIPDIVADIDKWKILRTDVNRTRKAIYRRRLKERRVAKEEKRREYMRSYMTAYRKRD